MAKSRSVKQKRAKTPMRPQPGNRGALKTGNPGNEGGTGRPDLAVRSRALAFFEKRLPVLDQIAGKAKARPRDRIAAIDKLGKYAGLERVEHTGPGGGPIPLSAATGLSIEIVESRPSGDGSHA